MKNNLDTYKKGNYEDWERLGLLDGLTREEGTDVAKLCGKMISFLETKQDSALKEFGDVSTVLFPIIRRIYSGTKKSNINVEELHDEYCEFYEKNVDKYMKLCINNIDGEAEMVAAFSELKIKNNLN